jgi:phosphoribosylaminoimidazolecarboxamide formyltransferase/IMP cyclohydrolase
MRALISVWDKAGLAEFAAGLAEVGCELVATGGTAASLEELALEVTRVDELTEMPELLGGRVKTLHPRVHAGILARADRADDVAALDEHQIDLFDLVCVNLYPFEQAREVEMIDVGGPTLLRAAAKNWARVAAVCRPEQYGPVLDELRAGAISDETRRRLAGEAFAATASYDALVAAWLADEEFPARLTLSFDKVLDLTYGENPHQRAAYYAALGTPGHVLADVGQLSGKPLSYNNLDDLAAARLLLAELDGPGCVIVKHANPCGAAEADTAEEAYERAFACDPLSAYGAVVVVDRPVDARVGERIARQFVEVLLAPEYADAALAALAAKPATRILVGDTRTRNTLVRGSHDFRCLPGALLVQERDAGIDGREGMELVRGELDEAGWQDAVFAWRVCKHVSSNAIVIAKNRAAIGIGAGQQSRVDAVRLALEKARERGHDLVGAVLASDGFFPFADGPALALEAGVRALVQPGGSKRDDEVIDVANRAGAAMVFTGRRHFRHSCSRWQTPA